MTEQTTTPETEQPAAAPANDVLERLERQQRESLERASRISRAWSGPEARAVHEFIRADGNVDWREFVTHCGGILAVVDLVDENGRPDADRIIPKVDELFAKYAVKEFAGGMTMTLRPQNRPYRPKGGASWEEQRAAFPGDRDAREGEAERLLREEQEAASRPPTTHPR